MEHTPKISAFLEQVNSGKMHKDLHTIYRTMRHNNSGWTLSSVETCMGFKRSTAAGRLSDLTDMGLIYQMHGIYFITPEDRIEAYAQTRENQRYERWRKLGEEKGWFGQQRMAI
jgi:Mn-dependent DtxR family transcriptional regulator